MSIRLYSAGPGAKFELGFWCVYGMHRLDLQLSLGWVGAAVSFGRQA